jgi:hypothetical protein
VALRRVTLLVGAGLVSEAVYLAVTLRLPWWRYGGRLQSWPRLLCPANACQIGWWGSFAVCLVGVGILVAAYVWGWQVIRESAAQPEYLRQARHMTWVFAGLFATTLFWLMPITSDLFTYLTQAHLFTDQGANPLLVAALDLKALDPARDRLLLAYPTFYATSPSVYGPAWLLLSMPGTLGPHDVVGGLFYLKGLAFVAYLGCAGLLEHILSRRGSGTDHRLGSGRAAESLYLFAWNPLVLLMAVGDGHNDILMMAAVLLAVWFLVQESWTLALGTLVLSAWIKYVSAICLPLFVVHFGCQASQEHGRSMWLAMVRGGLVAVVVSILVLLPFGRVEWGVGLVGRLMHPLNWSGSGAGPWGVLGNLSARSMIVGLLVFVVAYVLLVRRLLRRGTLQDLLDASFLASFLVFLLGAARSQPWHLIWPTALAGLSQRRWAWPAIIGLSAVMLVSQVWVEWGAPGLGISP